MTRLTDLLLRRGSAKFAKPLPVMAPTVVPEFLKGMITEIVGGTMFPAVPPKFAGYGNLVEMHKPVVAATVFALRQLAQGLPVDKALVRERLGRFADDFLAAFDEVVRPTYAAQSAPELQRSATEILTRLDALPKDRLERAERVDELVGRLAGFRSDWIAPQDDLWVKRLEGIVGNLYVLELEKPLTRREQALLDYVQGELDIIRNREKWFRQHWDPAMEAFRQGLPVPATSLDVYWEFLSRYHWYPTVLEDKKLELLQEIAGQSPEHAELLRAFGEWKFGDGPRPIKPWGQ